MRQILIPVLRFILFLLLQVVVFNNINLFGYFNPLLYVMPLLMLPIHMNKTLVIIIAFFVGLSVDVFYGVLGIHACACIVASAFRYPIMSLIHNLRERSLDDIPTVSLFGIRQYIIFAFLFILIHHTIIYFLDIMSFRKVYITLLFILINAIITTIFVALYQVLFHTKEKR